MRKRTNHEPDQAESREELARKLDELIDNAEELMRSTASYGGAEIESARGRLKSQLSGLRREGSRRRAKLVRNYRKVSAATRDYAQEHSWQVWGALAVVGLIASVIMIDTLRHRR